MKIGARSRILKVEKINQIIVNVISSRFLYENLHFKNIWVSIWTGDYTVTDILGCIQKYHIVKLSRGSQWGGTFHCNLALLRLTVNFFPLR